MRRGATVAAALWIASMTTAPAPIQAQSGAVVPTRPPAPPRPTREQVAVWRVTAEERIARWTTPRLTTFRDESEFRAYLADLDEWRRVDGFYFSARRTPVQLAAVTPAGQQSDAGPPVCMRPQDCPEPEQFIVVTGSRRSSPPRPRSITNNQEAEVEEGDIVKQIGNHLLILQDGRIFAVDTQGGADRRRFVLTDRANVYRDPASDAWYDEMLVFDDRIVVTAYSYQDQASEISVFRLDQATGRLSSQGVFLIGSSDYYGSRNYSTRIVDGQLVVYTPLDPDDIRPEGRDRHLRWPSIRRWRPGAPDAATAPTTFGASNIYRPVGYAREPIIHAISICPLEPVAAGRDLACRTTGFAGAQSRILYVSPRDAYLFLWEWDRQGIATTWPDIEDGAPSCNRRARRLDDVVPGAFFLLPIRGREPSVVAVRGAPIDQFAIEASGGQVRALQVMMASGCGADHDNPQYPLSFLQMPDAAFTDVAVEAPASVYQALPSVPGADIAARFTDSWLVYGGRTSMRYDPRRDDQRLDPAGQAVALPLARPRQVRRLDIPHSILRAERAGDDIVMTGYADRSGLSISLIDLSGRPDIASTETLSGRYESEGRSHAFNSDIGTRGAGIMGLPTVAPPDRASRDPWRSRPSDVSFLTVDRDRRLRSVGLLTGGGRDPGRGDEDDPDDDARPGNRAYRCEVSCVDWYGNTRPIFTDGRIFALSGTQLVEGTMRSGRIREVQRIDLTDTPRR